ncbi:antibiotic biosynthesis monooxygenase [Pseudonocardia sp. DR1-2]|uniref:putative quinol monooxygenase n=1 Tax=Pseudonocardia sp. DR1-2 TaxID=2951168 RepID=UPI0020433A0D|nr:antibiotic biosynthesis monooxygenase family protein [Pseudonocardia sp. DR1-2]MCM3848552.1 antibiotic biosynthesis monooxygenase [Pseudonocardia sp. DR1-2]
MTPAHKPDHSGTLVIAGAVYVDPRQQRAFVDAHKDLIRAARAFPGCLDIAVTPDPVDAARVYLFELWESDERLQEWRAMAPVPADVPPIIRDEVQLHLISSSGSPF